MAKTSPYTPEAMRARFHELTRQIAAVRAKTDPLKARQNELAALVGPLDEEKRAVGRKIREIESAELVHLLEEHAVLARGLGNKVGVPPEA